MQAAYRFAQELGLELEELERIPPSEGDRLLYARIKQLGLTESADLLLQGRSWS